MSEFRVKLTRNALNELSYPKISTYHFNTVVQADNADTAKSVAAASMHLHYDTNAFRGLETFVLHPQVSWFDGEEIQ